MNFRRAKTNDHTWGSGDARIAINNMSYIQLARPQREYHNTLGCSSWNETFDSQHQHRTCGLDISFRRHLADQRTSARKAQQSCDLYVSVRDYLFQGGEGEVVGIGGNGSPDMVFPCHFIALFSSILRAKLRRQHRNVCSRGPAQWQRRVVTGYRGTQRQTSCSSITREHQVQNFQAVRGSFAVKHFVVGSMSSFSKHVVGASIVNMQKEHHHNVFAISRTRASVALEPKHRGLLSRRWMETNGELFFANAFFCALPSHSCTHKLHTSATTLLVAALWVWNTASPLRYPRPRARRQTFFLPF